MLINFSGRLLYTTGHVKEAVTVFLGLLKSSALSTSISAIAVANEDESRTDEVYIEDFRIAFEVGSRVFQTKLQTDFFEALASHILKFRGIE